MDNAEFIKKVYSHYKEDALFLIEDGLQDHNKKTYFKMISLLDDFSKYFSDKVEIHRNMHNSELDNGNKETALNIDKFEPNFISEHIKSCIFNNISVKEYLLQMSNKKFRQVIQDYKEYTKDERSN